jgi:lipid-A-disaccharide synthase
VTSQAKQVMLVVGEASGDVHGASLVKALHRRDGGLKIFGVAGEQLQRTNFEALFNVSKLTGMGLVELAGNVKNIWRAYRLLRDALRRRKPNLLILIDFPEFNLRLARIAKSLRIPVLYYISPQIWAWRRGRVRQIAKSVDRMAVVFPFEVEFYRAHGVNVTFVGHPLLETVSAEQSREAVLAHYGLDPLKKTIALLPGSRHGEVSRHLPTMLAAAKEMQTTDNVQFLCLRASTIDAGALRELIPARISIVEEDRYEAAGAADLVWTASGTATLETALLSRPMVIVYRMSWLTYTIARLLVRVEHIGMVNLLAGKRLVPELVQDDFNASRLIAESRRLLGDDQARSSIVEELTQLRQRLGSPGAAERVAEIAIGMIT